LIGAAVIEIIVADITTLDADAIVNAANSALAGGGGVDGAIHRRAGPGLARAAMALGPCPTGKAVLTPGFGLPARFVIHAVGPVWWGGNRGERELLALTYESAFAVALGQGGIRSIAFPAISTGAYAFPKPAAAQIAVAAMRRHEAEFERIVACVFDEESARYYRRSLENGGTSASGVRGA
jgi:O-acetyl-ADP-ribose deacetylase (regulator of RNase III)